MKKILNAITWRIKEMENTKAKKNYNSFFLNDNECDWCYDNNNIIK